MAPEMIKVQDDYTDQLSYTSKVDVWSLGLVFAELLTKQLPKIDKRKMFDENVLYREGVPAELVNLCSSMLR